MKKLRFSLGFLTAMTLAFTPAVSPVGPLVMDASAAGCSTTSSSYSTYQVVKFTSTGSCTWTVPSGVSSVSYLVVAGGGGGGGGQASQHGGGGGGAGGALWGTTAVSSTVSVTVGVGGTGGATSGGTGDFATAGTNGGNSVFGSVIAIGGGGGGAWGGDPKVGGSGGGAGNVSGNIKAGAAGTYLQGYQGGSVSGGTSSGNWGLVAAGGGGRAAAGGSAVTNPDGTGTAGNGGPGITNYLDGTARQYAGGGGGGGLSTGGLGSYGGGNGGNQTSGTGANATANTGSGGGGGHGTGGPNAGRGGNGGSGIIVLRYSKIPDAPTSVSASSGDGQATITYSAPTHTGGSAITDFEYSLNSGSSWTSLGETDGSTVITGLSNGTSYSIQLRAVNADGYSGSASSGASVTPSFVGEILRLDATHPDSYGGSGTTWADLAGSLDGTLTNGPIYSTREKAFQFDGTNDYVDLPDISYDFSNGLAIHVVADFGEVDTWERLIDFGQGPNDLDIFLSRIWTTNDFGLDISNSSRIGYCRTIDGEGIQPGIHTYSAVVSASGGCSLYRDGVQLAAYVTNDANPTVSPTPSRAETATTFLPDSVARTSNFVGLSNWSSDDDFNGKIQSVVVYNTAQTTPICKPVESTFTGDGTIGDEDVPYTVAEFTTAGPCLWTVPSGIVEADYLVVAGGGGGGGHIAGGGGAGEVVSGTKSSLSPGTQYTMTVGVGGVGGVRNYYHDASYQGQSGADSSAFMLSGAGGITANGGGGGGNIQNSGKSGGSGGGAGAWVSGDSALSGGASVLDGSGYGNVGGAGGIGGIASAVASGGGGAGAAGGASNVSTQSGGAGGAGRAFTITGASVTYAGGGGGGINTGAGAVSAGDPGVGGVGGGGAGGAKTDSTANADSAGQAGVANLGAGGGGASGNGGSSTLRSGGHGGSGTVIVRYSLYERVEFDPNGGSGATTSQLVNSGSSTALNVNTFTRSGYTFAGWDTVAGGGGTDYSDQQSVTITNSLTLYAQWTLSSYTVTWNSNGGSSVSSSSVNYGADLSAPSPPTRAGYHFVGWSATDGGSVVSFPYAHPNTADFTMYAKWERATYTLSFDNNYSGGSSSTSTYYSGDTLTLPTPTRSGYTLNGWYTSSSGGSKVGDSGDTYSPLSSSNLILRYELDDPDSYPGTGTTVTDISSAVNSGVSGTVNATATNGPTFSTSDGMSFSFDGNNDYLLTGDLHSRVSGVSDISLFAWVYPTGNGVIVDELGQATISPPGSPIVGWHDSQIEIVSGAAKFGLWGAAAGNIVSEPITLNEWVYLGITYSSGTMKAFVNGQQVGSTQSFTRLTPEGYSANLRYALGAGDSTNLGDGTYGNFKLGSFHVYKAGISDQTVLNNYKATCARFVDGCTEQTLYAQWTADDKTITFAAGDNGTGSTQTATKSPGVSYTIPNASTSQGYFTRTGYTLTGWATNSDGTGTSYAFGDSYSTHQDLTLYPVWTINTYTLTLNKGTASGAAGSDQTATKTYGVNYALPNSTFANATFTRTGHTVTGWSTTAAGLVKDYDFGDSFTTNATTTLYPYWTADTYTITYSAGDDGSGSDVTATKTYGVDLSLANSATANSSFTRTHYLVTAWSINSDGSTTDYALNATHSANEALTLYPVWTANTYTVTYTYNGATGGNSTATSSYVYDGIVVSLPSPTKTGYTFGGWYSNVGLSVSAGAAGANFTTTGDVTLYAKWTAATFTVVYEYNGATGGNSTTDDDFTTGGTVITLPTPTKTGYTFGGWYSNAGLTSLVGAGGASYSPTSNRTVYAKWTAVTRSVTYHNNGSPLTGSVPVDATSYIIGDTVVVKANTGGLARTGYSFGGWTTTYGSGTAKNAGETITVATADIDLYPKWVPETYTFIYHANGGSGSLARATDTYTTGDANTTLAGVGSLTKTGYTFGGWSTTPTGSDVGATYSSTSNVTLYAVWNIKSVTYSYAKGQDGDGNSLSGFSFTAPFPSGSTDDYGTVVTLSTSVDSEIDAQAPSGIDHQFYGWSDGSSVYNRGDTYILGETDPTFTAQWAKVYSVRYSYAGGTAAGSDLTTDAECLGGDNTCTNGQTITLNSRPTRAGYTFLGWQDQSGSLKSAAATTSISSTSYLFAAQWQAVSYNMNFNTMGGSNSVSNTTRTIGQLLEMPDPGTKTGYTFAGWSDGSTLHGVGTYFTVGASSKSFTAQWTPDVYTVTYDWQGGTSSTPKVSDTYTYDSGDMSLATASANGYTRDGYTFSGWSQSVGGSVETAFQPSANDVLYAVWADGNYTLSYNPSGGSVGSGTGTVPRTSSITLPTPVRDSFTFVGWYDAVSGGTKLGDGGASYTPTASETLYARWVQDSLYGVDLATLETANTYTASSATATDTTISHGPSSSSARVQIPTGALPDGTVVTVRYFKDTNRQADLISGENTYFFSLLVSWLYGSGNSATVPDTASGKPITVTLTNSNIKAGAMVYQVIGETVTELARATVDGSVTVELTEDPEVVVAATKPSAPTSVTGTSADSAASVSWTAATSGGAPVTKYTVTASPGGGTCETATTSCSISGLTNNTAYTFSVTATNAIGTSTSSSASSAVTPRGTTYTVTFNSNGGSSISAGSFFSGGSVSSPSSPSRSGYTFQGWSTTQDDDSTEVTFPYSPGVLNAITLYALWDVAPASSNSSSRARVVTPVTPATPTLPNLRILPRPTVLIPAPLKAPVIITSAPPVAGNETSVAVGGRSVASETVQEGDLVKVKTGQIEVGLSVPKPSPTTTVRPNPATASPEVVVGAADVARLDAKGLLPGSSVQVWLPGADGRELARSVVAADGSITADIPLTATRDQAPVPIGPQVLQVTGVDEQGNQTVIDMTINVVQGAPAPEFNRVENTLPDMRPGQSLATSAGVPQTVTIVGNSDTREVSVTSEDWSFTVSVPEAHGAVEAETQSSPTIRVVQEKTAEVSGVGFQPDTRVDIFLFSDPTLLGSFTVNADGSFTAEVFMDQRFAVVGDHTLQIQGVGTDGYVKAANLGVLVDEPLVATTAGDALGMLWWAIAAFIVLVLLIVVTVALRRGRRLA